MVSFNNDFFFLIYLIIKVTCGNMKDAQSLFDLSTKKSLSMYAAMMKGKNFHTWNYVKLDLSS